MAFGPNTAGYDYSFLNQYACCRVGGGYFENGVSIKPFTKYAIQRFYPETEDGSYCFDSYDGDRRCGRSLAKGYLAPPHFETQQVKLICKKTLWLWKFINFRLMDPLLFLTTRLRPLFKKITIPEKLKKFWEMQLWNLLMKIHRKKTPSFYTLVCAEVTTLLIPQKGTEIHLTLDLLVKL